MNCPSCARDNRPGAKFCGGCGRALAQACPSCGAAVEAQQRFCEECGAVLGGAAPVPPARAEPVAERRLVSLLFADLVGFTTLSEVRDAEEVRELLSRYFATCRQVVERYGGTVEKFIGDAVMAVWGTPVANEDDAERAVRTALELVGAVQALGEEVGIPQLRLRAGVATGEAAVTLGATGEGMVAGDLVNTASRIQALAEPGTVLVAAATRRASEAAVAYEDAGERSVKGRTETVHVFRALRVIAARRGEGRSLGPEPPFVGREREFRLVKDLFHASAEERRARLVSIVGVAGTGKSRLSWEFEKYIDGLAGDVLWHRGRCLAYGEGVAFWALAEMVRMRARIAEDDSPDLARGKLAEAVGTYVEDVWERTLLEARLAHLLGLADRTAPDREDLFSAWRLFVERMAERNPVVLVFEDLQWGDAGLLDFIEYLLDWSRGLPVFVLTLARPELHERRPTWGAGQRDFTSLFLDALAPDDIDALLRSVAPGLPDELQQRIVQRAEGMPLYAVETVRMLLDHGLLERVGDTYRPTGRIESLAVPESLQSLAAARLDALDPAERRLLGDAAVLGRTFTRSGLYALSGMGEVEVDQLLQSLLRKEILSVELDPRSPERGQLAFVQDLLRRVAYDTLSRRERKQRHLAAAVHLAAEEPEQEIAAVIAAHYLDAYRASAGDPDEAELKSAACSMLTRAAERAASLAAAGEAGTYFTDAAALADDAVERALLLERAGLAVVQHGDLPTASKRFEDAVALLQREGRGHAAARVSARLAECRHAEGLIDEGLEQLQDAYRALSQEKPDADFAMVAAHLGRLTYFLGKNELAGEAIEQALDIAEGLRLPEVLAEGLITKGMMLWRRPHESEALMRQGLAIALANDLTAAALRARFNLSGLFLEHSRLSEGRELLQEAVSQARRRGDRVWEGRILQQLAEVLVELGDWDAALTCTQEVTQSVAETETVLVSMLLVRARIGSARGDVAEAQRLAASRPDLREAADVQDRGAYMLATAMLQRAAGDLHGALATARVALPEWNLMQQFHYSAQCLVEAVEAALALGESTVAAELLDEVEALPTVSRRPVLTAHQSRLRGLLAAHHGDAAAEGQLTAAAAGFDAIAMPYWRAVSQLDLARVLVAAGRSEEAAPVLAEARSTFERLAAAPWVERADALVAVRPPGAATAV